MMQDLGKLIGFTALMQVPFRNDPDALAYLEEIRLALKELEALKAEPQKVETKVELRAAPTESDWLEVKRRALATEGKRPAKAPDSQWKYKILRARHSPIRYLVYSYYIENIPSWVATHLVRHHEGFQPYVQSQRNDRQDKYDRNSARQDAPVNMWIDLNAEALQVLANKRLCNLAAAETRAVVAEMCRLAAEATPELESLLVPACVHQGGECHEMKPCGWR